MSQKNNDRFYTLTLSKSAWFRGTAYTLGAGGGAAIVTKVVASLLLPEMAALAISVGAFREAAHATATVFNSRLKPGDVVMREWRRPRLDI